MQLWTEVRRRVLAEKLSKRAACEAYGLGWQTLTKILTHEEPPGYRQQRRRKKPRLDPFLPILQQLLIDDLKTPPKQRHTARRIFERLRDEHRYHGDLTMVQEAVRKWRQSQQEVFLPLSHPPGEAQVDFGEAVVSKNVPSLTAAKGETSVLLNPQTRLRFAFGSGHRVGSRRRVSRLEVNRRWHQCRPRGKRNHHAKPKGRFATFTGPASSMT